jgi:hypothetical protein
MACLDTESGSFKKEERKGKNNETKINNGLNKVIIYLSHVKEV